MMSKLQEDLEKSIFTALEHYSNVHRGSGYKSIVSTHLFETAREKVLDFLGKKKSSHSVIFCSPISAERIVKQLKPSSYEQLSSKKIGLSLGVHAIVVKKAKLPPEVPYLTGGGTAKLTSRQWVIPEKAPARYEAGTPAIINIIAFTRALQLLKKSGEDYFEASGKRVSIEKTLKLDEFEGLDGKEILEILRSSVIGKSITVPTLLGEQAFINMDSSASTPSLGAVWEVFRKAMILPVNSRQKILEKAKEICFEFLDASPEEYDLIFTSNTTESINLLASAVHASSGKRGETAVLGTLLEHSSNDLPWRWDSKNQVEPISFDANGFLNLQELEKTLKDYNENFVPPNKSISLVTVSGASNVLGSCNNLEEISAIVHSHGAMLAIDAAQLVAHRKIDMNAAQIDFLAFSAHKIYAPFGCGVLIARKGLLNFDSDELSRMKELGEENIAGIAALGKSLSLLKQVGMNTIAQEEKELTEYLLSKLKEVKGITIYGIDSETSDRIQDKIGVVPFNHKSIISFKLGKLLSLHGGIGIRYGCHCAHITVKHVLGVGPGLERFQWVIQRLFAGASFPGVARVSLGVENSKTDIDRLVSVLNELASASEKKNKGQNKASKGHHVNTISSLTIEIKNQKKDISARIFN